MQFDKYVEIKIAKGCKFSLVNGCDYENGNGRSDGQLWGSAFYFLNSEDTVTGAGVFEIATAGVVSYGSKFFNEFKGEIVDSLRNFVSTYTGRNGAGFAAGSGNFNSEATMTLAGYVNGFSASKSVGTLGQGCSHGSGNPDSQTENGLPYNGLKLNGGYIKITAYGKAAANFRPTTFAGQSDYEALNETAKLTIAGGLSEIDMSSTAANGQPISHFVADSLVQEDSGTLFVYDYRTRNGSTSARAMTELKGFADHFVGNTGTVDEANDVFPIVPWIVTRYSDDSDFWWAHVGDDDVMCRGGVHANKKLTEVDSPLRNVYCKDNGVALTDDVTVNALVIEGQNKEKKLGAGKTLTITSGGLIIKSNDNGFGTAATVDDNGLLVFLNRAYVWACASDANYPDVIWSPITSPYGFCAAGAGQLRLGGDQTGIDGDITVNNGTLQLGDTSGHGCTLDVPINLVGGNTKLVVNQVGTLNKLTLNLSCPGGYGPQITVPAAGEKCYRAYVDGKALDRGTYGVIGSGAQHESEYIASGSGYLQILKDDHVGIRLILR